MTEEDWGTLIEMYTTISKGRVNRIDHPKFTIYKVGTIVRIDISPEVKKYGTAVRD